jgi:hypothetical protein
MIIQHKIITKGVQPTPEALRVATRRALQKAARQTEVQLIRSIRERYNIKRSVLDKLTTSSVESITEMKAKISGKGRRIPLREFLVRERPATVMIVRGVRKVLKPLPSQSKPFVATMRTGHKGVFARQLPSTRWSRGRPQRWQPNLPIVERFSLSVAEMMRHLKIRESLAEMFRDKFPEILRHEIDFALQQEKR